MISIEQILGWMFGGIAMRIYAAGGAIWIASEAAGIFTQSLHSISHVMG